MEERREIVYSDISGMLRRGNFDAMVYLEGTSVIAVDSIGNVIARGTAGTDDAAVIQAAVDRAGTIYISEGTYYPNLVGHSTPIRVASNTRIIGSNRTKLIGRTYGILISGSKTDTVVNITTDVATASHEIVVSDASGFAVGDYILINSDRRTEYLNAQYGEIRRIDSITDTTLTIDPTNYYYNVVDNPIATKLDMPYNITIENLELEGYSPLADHLGIKLEFARNVTLRNLHVHHFGGSNITISSSSDVTIERCILHDSKKEGLGYGIAIGNASENISVNNNYIYNNGNHAVTIGGTYADGYPTNIIYTGNYLSNPSSTADSHYGGLVIYENNIFYASSSRGLGAGADTVIVKGCSFLGTATTGIRPRSDDTCMLRNLYVSNCVFGGGISYGVRIQGTLAIDNISVTNCHFSHCERPLHFVTQNPESGEPTPITSVTFSNNVMKDCQVAVYMPGARYADNVYITGNTVKSYTGIPIITAGKNVVVANNTCYAPIATATEVDCVVHISRADRATITGNTFKDSLGGAIRIARVNDMCTISNNYMSGGDPTATTTDVIQIAPVTATVVHINNNVIAETNLQGSIKFTDVADDITIADNHLPPGLTLTAPATCKCRHNTGYVTESKGTATLLNTTTSVVVAHGCAVAPTNITVTPGSIGNATKWYVDTIGDTNFTIHVDQDPGADITFYWRAEV